MGWWDLEWNTGRKQRENGHQNWSQVNGKLNHSSCPVKAARPEQMKASLMKRNAVSRCLTAAQARTWRQCDRVGSGKHREDMVWEACC